ncbi:MAG TPA: FtsX-like permease family protein [Nitrospirota bacterium]|nr:FtsX-like permease family protein [Nitrospirota bacterium]
MTNLSNLLRHISIKRIRLQKVHALMTVAGICLGVAAIVSIGIVNKSVLRSFEDSINRVTGRAALQVTGAASGFPEGLLDLVQRVPGVEYAVPVIDTQGILVGAKERSLMILGVDVLQDSNIRDYKLTDESADIPDPLLFLARPDSILLTRELAEREGIKIEQTIQVQTVRGIRTFRVRGLLNPEGPAKTMGGNIAIMDYPAAQMAFGKEGRIDRIDVSLLRGEDLETMRGRIKKVLPEGYNVVTPEGRTRQVELLISRFQKNINLISFIAVFVGMYLIYNAVSISVVQRRKEIGILRALGTTRRQIIALFLGETFVIAIIGSALGVAVGIFFAKSAIGAVGQTVSELYLRTSISELSISWTNLVVGFVTGMIASLTAALFPAITSTRISPISAIRSVPYSEEGFISGWKLKMTSLFCISLAVALLLLYKAIPSSPALHSTATMFGATIFLLLGISLATPTVLQGFLQFFRRALSSRVGAVGRLAGLNLQKNIGRNAVAAAAIFYGISVFVSSAGIIYSTKQSVLEWIDSYVRGDIIVTSGHPIATTGSQNIPMPVEMWKEIEKVPGVLSADPFRKIYIDYKGRRILLLTLDIDRRMLYSPFKVMQGKREDMVRLLPKQNYIAVNEAIASQEHLKPGDTMVLPTPEGPVPFMVAVVNVDYSSDSGSILMDMHTYRKYWKEYLADSFSIRVKSKDQVLAVRDAIAQRFGNDRKLFVLPAREFKNEIRKVIDQGFAVNHAINIITLLIACLGIIVTLLASVLERTREIGILRSIGMQRSQVSRVVVVESMLLGIVGGALGAGAGVIIGWMSLEGFLKGDYGASMQYHVDYSSILWALALSTLLAALAGVYPAQRAAKINIVEALSYE